MTAARFDASTAECLLFTWKAGLLAAAAHDLKLRVGRFEIALSPDAVSARFDASSLQVVCARAGGRDLPGALSERDRREIEATAAKTVLAADRYPWIEFRSESVIAVDDRHRVDGTLSLHGRQHRMSLVAMRHGDRTVVEALIHQPDFGIHPYTAMLGALRIKPDVGLQLSVPWPGGT